MVYRPQQPVGFQATVSSDITNVTGDGTVYTVVFGSTTKNFYACYNGSTTFTAPESAFYIVNGIVGISNIGVAHTVGSINLVSSLKTYAGPNFNPFTASAVGGTGRFPFCDLIYLLAGETVTVTLTISGSTKTITVEGDGTNAVSMFSAVKIAGS